MSRELKRITANETTHYVKLPAGEHSTLTRATAFTLTPSIEEEYAGWEDVTYYGPSIFDPSGAIKKPEWIYILVNGGIPGICKIGMTTTSVSQRVKEINSATGVITPWYPVHSYKCVNSYYLEQEIHKYLEDRGYRVNPNREGFEIDSNTAITIIEELGSKYQSINDPQNLNG